MVSREKSVIAAAFALCLAAFLLGAALGLEGPIYAVVVLIVIPVLGPQLSLAATGDDELPSSTRIRAALLISAGLCALFGFNGTEPERRLIWNLGVGFFLAFLAYEVRAGYLRRTATH
ncbi:hypothetical protein [Natrinema amylolyticum]|uniref:hypothetical protein n=1 Tax=Natrinema amylolyticum TaxID=2878679 RepID=UPI001CF9D211|nr:hypothetical protein [Natrinema amylolyticum]